MLGGLPEVGAQQVRPMNEVFDITLRAQNGQERKLLQWFPTPATRQELFDRRRQRGIEVTDEKEIFNQWVRSPRNCISLHPATTNN